MDTTSTPRRRPAAGLDWRLPLRVLRLAHRVGVTPWEALAWLESALADLDALIAKKRAVKTAAMQRLLTGRQRLPGFEGAWETVSLDSVAGRTAGYWGANNKSDRHPNPVHIVRAGDVTRDGKLSGTAERYVSDAEFANAQCALHDIVMTVSGTLGNAWLCDGRPDTVASNFVRILRPGRGAHGPFLAYVLRSDLAAKKVVEYTGTGAISNLRRSFFAEAWVSLPPVDEQAAIAAVLTDMDAEIAALDARRAKTAMVKTGMMQELLTGRTRLVS